MMKNNFVKYVGLTLTKLENAMQSLISADDS